MIKLSEMLKTNEMAISNWNEKEKQVNWRKKQIYRQFKKALINNKLDDGSGYEEKKRIMIGYINIQDMPHYKWHTHTYKHTQTHIQADIWPVEFFKSYIGKVQRWNTHTLNTEYTLINCYYYYYYYSIIKLNLRAGKCDQLNVLSLII